MASLSSLPTRDHTKPHPAGPRTHILVAAVLSRQQRWALTHVTTDFVCGIEISPTAVAQNET